jgi:hypothetical protein
MKKLISAALLLVLVGTMAGCYVGPAHRRPARRGGVVIVP